MKGILKIFLALFVLSIAKAKPVPEWENEKDWEEAWEENPDALDEDEDDYYEGWDEEDDEEAWDEEEDEEAWDEEEDEEAWDKEEDEKPWDDEEDEEAWDEEDSGEDEAWEGGDNTVLQDDLTGGESGEDNGNKE